MYVCYFSLCSAVIFGKTFSRFLIASSDSELWEKLTHRKSFECLTGRSPTKSWDDKKWKELTPFPNWCDTEPTVYKV